MEREAPGDPGDNSDCAECDGENRLNLGKDHQVSSSSERLIHRLEPRKI